MPEETKSKNMRDVVLSPNEFAYVQNETKGTISTYIGPYKYTPEGTDRLMRFDEKTKKFEEIHNLLDAKQLFVTAPKGYYVLLKNPAADAGREHPRAESVESMAQLQVGKKVNIQGPVSFALWPGQMARLVKGHDLRSNQYLIVRVYDGEAAKASWDDGVLKGTSGEDVKLKMPDLVMGKLLIIKGTDASFYIPPTGLEVVRDAGEGYVREAVTLERLEYCILLDESGNKRYIYGPDVVFPEPTETFIEAEGRRKFKAIELTKISGVYVKVIVDYTEDDGTKRIAGDELFITGQDQPIYYPRPEHAAMKYGDGEFIHYAISIPAGEARYVLDRETGEIFKKNGPAMFLPDPRRYVIVRRILPGDTVKLWFPGNEVALQYNLGLQTLATADAGTPDNALSESTVKDALRKNLSGRKTKGPSQEVYSAAPQMSAGASAWSSADAFAVNYLSNVSSADMAQYAASAVEDATAFVGDEFTRKSKYTPPRTITLDTKYEGAVRIDVWTGYAILVKSANTRKVIVGPQTYLLEYDETLESMVMSTGKPKNADSLKKTSYLRVLNNKVSDIVSVETNDMCMINIKLSYRVNFEGNSERWFDVENYVKFLTDHARSMLKNTARRYTIGDFFANAIDIIRDALLGKASGDDTKRPGLAFDENGMRVYDLEVLDVSIDDKNINKLLLDQQQDSISQTITIKRKEKELEVTKKVETIKQEIKEVQTKTVLEALALEMAQLEKEHEKDIALVVAETDSEMTRLQGLLIEQERTNQINLVELLRLRAKEDELLEISKNKQDLTLEVEKTRAEMLLAQLKAEVAGVKEKAQALTPGMIEAMNSFGDKDLAARMAQSLGGLAVLEDRSLIDTLIKVVGGVPAVQRIVDKISSDKK
jgi:major vault protein